MKVLLFAPVLRQGSFNKKLIHIVYRHLLEQQNCTPELVEFNEFPMPMYDGDLEIQKGIPDGVKRLAKKIEEADAIIISSPEYNWSIPGTFKNAIDWLSRLKPVPLENKHICLIGASIGQFAGMRGQIAARVPLQALKAHTYPDYFGLAKAETAFDEQGHLKDPQQTERLKGVVDSFLKYAEGRNLPFERLDEFLEEQIHQSPQQH
ncbi:NADPH-dependent FMN reductase [Bdellovibrio sp. HCB2-146]|uniref:NADPH-dependent FMN reductase n=1 Tax=Bdellovibrio sp. HCB2-146 TaxID=3394362 RepID=UPI0039BCFE19